MAVRSSTILFRTTLYITKYSAANTFAFLSFTHFSWLIVASRNRCHLFIGQIIDPPTHPLDNPAAYKSSLFPRVLPRYSWQNMPHGRLPNRTSVYISHFPPTTEEATHCQLYVGLQLLPYLSIYL